MRIASPCHVGWERMTGDERVRFCDQCNLHVYNISEMTCAAAEALIASTEGRICARLYRRTDGTVLTRDCPVGLRALRKRVARIAGVALTALLSLCSGVAAQSQSKKHKARSQVVALKIKRTPVQNAQGTFDGIVTDEVGGLLAGAKITLTNEHTKEKMTATSTGEGKFSFPVSITGEYGLEIEATGFAPYKQEHLLVNANEMAQVEATLNLERVKVTEVIGVIAEPAFESGNGITIFSSKEIQSLPHE